MCFEMPAAAPAYSAVHGTAPNPTGIHGVGAKGRYGGMHGEIQAMRHAQMLLKNIESFSWVQAIGAITMAAITTTAITIGA